MIELKKVCKTYRGDGVEVQALKGVDLTLPEKGMVFVLGKSGGGKSTLLNVMGCLDTFDSGELIIDGVSTKDFSQEDFCSFRSHYLGFIFQEFHIITDYTIGKNIALASEIQGNSPTLAEVESVLTKVGLQGFGKRKVKTLSGGQKQRIAIARALIKDTKVLLSDEPTGALDKNTGIEIFELLRELSKEKLVILVSHDAQAAEMYADRIVEISDGQIVDDRANVAGQQTVTIDYVELTEDVKQQIRDSIAVGKNVYLKNRKIAPPPRIDSQIRQFVPKHTRLSLSSISKLSLASMRNRLGRIFLSIVLAVMSLTFIATATMIASFDSNELILDTMEQGNEHFLGFRPNYVEKNGILTTYGLKEYSFPYDYEQLVQAGLPALRRQSLYIGARMGTENAATGLFREYVTIIQYDKLEDTGLELLAGRQPQSLNEVLISSLFAEGYLKYGIWHMTYHDGEPKEVLFKPETYEQLLDKELLYWHSYSPQALKIVGILDTNAQEYMHFLDTDYVDDSYRASNEHNNIYTPFDLYLSIVLSSKGGVGLRLYGQKQNSPLSFMDLADFEAGNTPYIFLQGYSLQSQLKENEFVVSYGTLLEEYPEYFESLGLTFKSNWQEVLQKTHNFAQFLGEKMQLEARIRVDTPAMFSFEFTIVGVVSGKVSLFEDMSSKVTEYQIFRWFVIAKNNYTRSELMSFIKTAQNINYTCNITGMQLTFVPKTAYSASIRGVGELFAIAKMVFPVLSVVFVLFSVLLMYNIISLSIEARKKDSGILRAMGARRSEVASIFVTEQGIITAIVSILSLVASFIVCRVLQNKLYVEFAELVKPPKLIDFSVFTVLAILGVAIVSAVLALLVPILRLNRHEPIELIR